MVWLGLFLSGLVALPGLVWFLAGLVIWPDQVSLYAYVHLQTYMYVAMHFYVCICLYICAHPCTCVDLFVYLHVYLFVFAQETRPERERDGQAAALLQGESWDLTAIVWQGGGACGSRVHMARKPWPAWGLQGEGVDQGQVGFTWILPRGERLSAGKA